MRSGLPFKWRHPVRCIPFVIQRWQVKSAWWRHQIETFSALLAICAGNSQVTGEFPAQSQLRGPLMFSLICAWIISWVNNREAGDLRRHRVYYDVIVMRRNHLACCSRHCRFYLLTLPFHLRNAVPLAELAVPADDLAPLGTRASIGATVTKFASFFVCTQPMRDDVTL